MVLYVQPAQLNPQKKDITGMRHSPFSAASAQSSRDITTSRSMLQSSKPIGINVGAEVGARVSIGVGRADGGGEGEADGKSVGIVEGCVDGDPVGSVVV